MTAIGDIVTRRKAAAGPKRLRIVGVLGTRLVGQDADNHSPPFEIDAARLAQEYNASVEPPESETELLQAADREASLQAANDYLKRTDAPVPARRPNISQGLREQAAHLGLNPRSPEEIFEAAAADAPDAGCE